MSKNLKDYKNLTGMLLGPIRERPVMYLGEPKISKLSNFIIGYQLGYLMAKKTNSHDDDYLGEFGFLEWFYKKYNIKVTSFWETPFLEKVKNNEEKALQLFFSYLEEYQNEKNKTIKNK